MRTTLIISGNAAILMLSPRAAFAVGGLRGRSIETHHALAEEIFGGSPDVQADKTVFILRTTKNVDEIPSFCLEQAAGS